MNKWALSFTFLCFQLLAQPNGAEVQSGAVRIETHGNVLEIQAPHQSIIHWDDFSIQAGEITRFIQPNETSAVLNRVTGIHPSMIHGILDANGRVILINPNGVIIGKDATIHASDFVGSTYDILDLTDWSIRLDREGAVHFQNGAAVNHEGYIQATGAESKGGRVYLVADSVNMKGAIEASLGTVEIYGTDVVIEESASIDVSSEFGGGNVLIGDDSFGSVTRIGSAVQIHADAKTAGDGGKVIVWSETATEFYGTATAHGGTKSGNGGFIEISSRNSLGCSGAVDASAPFGASGQILFDPCNITIGALAAGPAFTFPVYTPGANATITGLSIQIALAGGSDVTLNTSPGAGGTGIVQWDIGQDIFWGTSNKLTINADSDVFLQGNIFGTGDLEINSFAGDVNILPAGGNIGIVATSVRISAANNINMAGPGNITVGQGSEVELVAGGNILLNEPASVANIVILTFATAPTPITIDAGGSVIMGPNSSIQSESGPVLIIADQNIEMRPSSSIFYFTAGVPVPPFPIILVVDDQAPTAPQIGTGRFIMEAGSFIGDPTNPIAPPVQIFTALRNYNRIEGAINSSPFVPGPYSVDSDTERWRVYYPNPFLNPNSPFYTIFYKEPQPIAAIFTPLAQTIGQVFIVIDEFVYPPAFYEDHFCITECAKAIDENREEGRECPWIQIDNYRKFYPNRQKYAYLTSDDSPILEPNCGNPE